MKTTKILNLIAIMAIVFFTSCKNEVEVTGINLDKTTLSIEINDTSLLTATVLPKGAEGTIVWTSSNTAIVKVENGSVIGCSEGTADIVASIGSHKATCSVTVSKGEYTDVYFMDTYNETIEKLPIGGGASTVVAEDVYGSGLAYDKTNEKIYYSDFANDSTPDGKIWKADINGKNAVVIASGIQDPYGIAIDSKNKKIYWGDDNGNVTRSNLDGTSKENIVTIDGGGIRAVAIDATNSKLYFYDVKHNSLYKANLDGSSKTVIIKGYYGYAIAIDEKNGKIYFDGQTDNDTEKDSQLFMANLDGTNVVLVDDTQSRIYGIAVDTDNSKVYWSGRDTYEIYKANLNGTGKVTLNSAELGSPRGIFLKY